MQYYKQNRKLKQAIDGSCACTRNFESGNTINPFLNFFIYMLKKYPQVKVIKVSRYPRVLGYF